VLVALLMATVAAQVAALEPELEICDLQPKSRHHCRQAARKNCGTDPAYAECRKQYVRFCRQPWGEENLDACLQARCPTGVQGCLGEPGKPGLQHLCSSQICEAEKPCVIKCRASSLESCGVDEGEDSECRRRYMIGCVDEECHHKTRPAVTKSPEELEALADITAHKAFLQTEMSCGVMCKMQAYKKCGVTTGFHACRKLYRKDCVDIQCQRPQCENDCIKMAFSACGVGAKYDECRDDYRELCKPIRCRRVVCMREGLLECGEEKCRNAYVEGCMKRKNKKWEEQLTAFKNMPSLFKE